MSLSRNERAAAPGMVKRRALARTVICGTTEAWDFKPRKGVAEDVKEGIA
jgi:hypothetical protein